jgi:hypothetical protein
MASARHEHTVQNCMVLCYANDGDDGGETLQCRAARPKVSSEAYFPPCGIGRIIKLITMHYHDVVSPIVVTEEAIAKHKHYRDITDVWMMVIDDGRPVALWLLVDHNDTVLP